MALLPFGILPFLLCILFGLLLGPPPGAVMAQPGRILAPANRAVGLGAFFTCYYALVASGPALAGLLRDRSGTASAAVLLGALMFLAVAPCTAMVRLLAGPVRPTRNLPRPTLGRLSPDSPAPGCRGCGAGL